MNLSVGIVCYPGFGGSAVVASELAIGLAERGHDVHLIASALPSRAGRSADLNFHQVTVPDYPLFEHAPYSLALASKIAEVSRRQRLDLVQVHYAVPHATSGYLARQLLGASAPRLVTSLHGTDVTWVGADESYREITCFAVATSDGVTAPSASLRDQARSRLGLPERVAIEVIPNFVDVDRFSPAPERDRARLASLFPRSPGDGPILFHASTFRAVKRPGDLIEVLARVRRETPARLVAVGEGPERAAAERRAEELGVADHVRFLGKRGDFVDQLRHADAFVLTSQMESFGVAALEALSAGVPVFGYRVGGLPEVIGDGVGRLVAPFDVDALARAVLEVVVAPELHARMARAAREHVVAHFRREPAIARYEAYFRRILETPR